MLRQRRAGFARRLLRCVCNIVSTNFCPSELAHGTAHFACHGGWWTVVPVRTQTALKTLLGAAVAGPQPSRLCWHHVAWCLRFRARFGLQTRVPSGRGLGPKPGSSTAWRATSRGGPWTPGTRDTHGAPVEFGRVARGKLLSQACDDRLGFSGGPWGSTARSGRVVPHGAEARDRGCSARACATRTAAQEAEARARQPPSARAGLQADACERSLG